MKRQREQIKGGTAGALLLTHIMAEFRAIFADRGVLLVMGVAVVFYAFVYPLPYAKEVLRTVPVAVVDRDHSQLSRRLARMLDAAETLRIQTRAGSLAQAKAEILAGFCSAALVIPAGFEENVLGARQADVAAYADATYFLVYRQAMTGIVNTVATLSAGIQIRRYEARGRTARQAQVDRSPLGFVNRALFNPAMGYATYIVPGVLLLILQQTMLIGIGMISGTRTERMAQDGGAPARQGPPGLQILSRTLACLSLYLIHVLFIYGVAYPIWGFPLKAGLKPIFIYLLPFLLAVTMLGQMLAVLFKTRETAMVMIVWSSLIAVLASGFAWPPQAMPGWIRVLTLLLPSTWGISGALRLTQMGATFQQVWTEWLWLWGLSGLYFVLAWLGWHWRHRS